MTSGRPTGSPAAGNGHLGVLDAGDPAGALLSARLIRRGHHVTRWLLDLADGDPFADPLAADRTLAWPAEAPEQPVALIPAGDRRAWLAAVSAPPTTRVFAATGAVELADEVGLLVWMADRDAEVPRVLGHAVRAADLAGAVPTDGPVVVAHRLGDALWPERRCRDRRDLQSALDAASRLDAGGDAHGDGDASGAASWFLLEDVVGEDIAVAGVFRDGEPVAWGAWQVIRDDRNRPLRLTGRTDGRLFELAEECAGLLHLDGPCELRIRMAGTEAYLVGLTPCVTWPLLALGSIADDAISTGLAAIGVPCADRAPAASTESLAGRSLPVAPSRALATRPGVRRVARIWVDPWRGASVLPPEYRRWARRVGRRATAPPAAR